MKTGHGKKNVLLTGDWFDHIVLQTFDDDQFNSSGIPKILHNL
jgi:hypothetical protein